jgi:hypothetical protein
MLYQSIDNSYLLSLTLLHYIDIVDGVEWSRLVYR